MEGQTLFYKTLLAETEGPIRENISQLISELYDSLLFYDYWIPILKQFRSFLQFIHTNLSLRKKFPYSEFFWSVFSLNRTEYIPEKLRIRTLSMNLINARFETILKLVMIVLWGELITEEKNDKWSSSNAASRPFLGIPLSWS